MRLQAYLAQALPTTTSDNQRFIQLPGIHVDEIRTIAPKAKDMTEFLRSLEEKDDPRVNDVKKAMERWGHVEIVDAAFKGLQLFILSSFFANQHW
jgi:translocation protein SEC63